MLPFALKIVWFALAFLGILSAWLSLIGLAKTVKVYWAPVLYGVAVTVMEGAFCLGIIWKMDPTRMPRGFCLVQPILISISSNIITGICACLTWAIYATVFAFDNRFGTGQCSPLSWKNKYLFFVLVFPAMASTAYIVTILKLDAVRPMDSMHCEASNPLWPRVLSYAGAPLALMLPCLVISVVTVSRVAKVHFEAKKYRFTLSTVPLSQTTPRNSKSVWRCNSRSKLATGMHTSEPRHMMEVKVDVPAPAPAMSSQISLPRSVSSVVPTVKTTDTAVASSNTHVEPLPPMPFSVGNLHQLSSTESIRSQFTGRSHTPSPITFAPVAPPAPSRPSDSSNSLARPLYLPSFPDPGAIDTLDFSPSTPSLETDTLAGPSLASLAEVPSSPSRARVSFDDSDIRRGFHLPRRPSVDVPPRPSLELSPEYTKAQWERALEEPPPNLTGMYGYPPTSPQRVHSLRWVASQGELREEDEVTTVESIPYSRDRHGRIEVVSPGGRESVMKEELEFAENTASVDVMPARSSPFSRFTRRSSRSISAISGIPAVLWHMVLFQFCFATILFLAGLSTWIDLAKHRDPSPFGTQDVALLLSAWGPLIVFGHLPAVRTLMLSCLLPWRS